MTLAIRGEAATDRGTSGAAEFAPNGEVAAECGQRLPDAAKVRIGAAFLLEHLLPGLLEHVSHAGRQSLQSHATLNQSLQCLKLGGFALGEAIADVVAAMVSICAFCEAVSPSQDFRLIISSSGVSELLQPSG